MIPTRRIIRLSNDVIKIGSEILRHLVSGLVLCMGPTNERRRCNVTYHYTSTKLCSEQLCDDHFVRIRLQTEENFHQIWITMEIDNEMTPRLSDQYDM